MVSDEIHPKIDLMLHRLHWLGAPKVLLLIILMIGYLEPVDLTNNGREYQVLEFYAGAARLAKTAHHFGGSVAAMDRLYDTVGDNKSKNNAMDFNTSGGFVLACTLVLQSRLGQCISLMGIACATWVAISRGSTLRDIFNAMGDPHSLAVYRANKAVSRSMLLVMMIVCWEGVPILENPGSTLLNMHDRFRYLVQLLRSKGIGLFRQALWMKLWGHPCLKRTFLWSTSRVISVLDLGKIVKTRHQSLIKTTRKYIGKDGKTKYHGTKALKSTELYPVKFVGKIFENFDEMLESTPKLPKVANGNGKCIIETLEAMPIGDTWDDAELWTIYSYLRSSKLLRLPPNIKARLFTNAC